MCDIYGKSSGLFIGIAIPIGKYLSILLRREI